jgi:hypothetical protein
MKSMVSRDRYDVNDITLAAVTTQQYKHSALRIIIVTKLITLRNNQSRIYLKMLTFLKHSTIVSAIPMLKSILSASFPSTE